MHFRHCLWMLLGAAHLFAVVCGACDCLPEPSRSVPSHMVRWYAKLSGADSHYGFYAPEVGAEYRARFILQDQHGSTWGDIFEEAKSPEARLRQQGIVHLGFANAEAEESPDLRKSLVKSWAARMFTRHPSAVSLTVLVEVYDVPTMAKYRSGVRPTWAVAYQAQVHRDSSAAQERTKQ